MRYTHLVFDIDGTMLDSAYADLTALQRALFEVHGERYDLAALHFVLGIPSDVALERLGVAEPSRIIPLWNG